VVAISADDVATMKRFKESLGAPLHFVADPEKVLIKSYGIVMPLTGWAKRTTYVVGHDRKIVAMQEGMEAIEPEGAVRACGLHAGPKPDAGNAAKPGAGP
jgi:thioredoxin-dependent peroxiredoxin